MPMKSYALCVAAALGVAACSLTQKNIIGGAGSAQLYAVSSEKAPFYKFGPQQGNGPDMQLPRDTLMTLIRPSFGYCKVTSDKRPGRLRRERRHQSRTSGPRCRGDRTAAGRCSRSQPRRAFQSEFHRPASERAA